MREVVAILVDEIKSSGLRGTAAAVVREMNTFIQPLIVAQCFLPIEHRSRNLPYQAVLCSCQAENWDDDVRKLAEQISEMYKPSWVLALGWQNPGLIVELTELGVPSLIYIDQWSNAADQVTGMNWAAQHATEIYASPEVGTGPGCAGFEIKALQADRSKANPKIGKLNILARWRKSNFGPLAAAEITILGRKMAERMAIAADLARGPKATSIPAFWRKEPSISRPHVCVFVMLARGGFLQRHSVDHAKSWHGEGFDVVVVVISDDVEQKVDFAEIDFAVAILQRLNRGYDFGAWSAAIQNLIDVVTALDILVIANDSVIGPAGTFKEFVARARDLKGDVIGAVGSIQETKHLQSFVVFFKKNALRSEAFRDFWCNVHSGDKKYVIKNYELKMMRFFEKAGLAARSMFPTPADKTENPTMIYWRELISTGFPYLKIELLRLNTCETDLRGWKFAAAAAKFNLEQLDSQVRQLQSLAGC